MSIPAFHRIDWFSTVHLIAKILSIVSIGTILLFMIGENFGITKIAPR